MDDIVSAFAHTARVPGMMTKNESTIDRTDDSARLIPIHPNEMKTKWIYSYTQK
jgi:hypothetical protein